jgi:hypothetical protein
LGVTNTSDRVVAVKVRFREALNSRDVFDFNVILSPYDIWTGYLVEGGNGPILRTTDKSCTVGAIPAAGQPCTTTAYTGPGAADFGDTTVDRLRDGYVEMIMMGAAAETDPLASNAVHGSNGIPKNCAALVAAFTTVSRLAEVRATFSEYPTSPLKGTFSLVNSSPGKGFNAVGLPTALNNFRTEPYVTMMLPPNVVGPANDGYEPTLAAAQTQGVYYNASTDALVPGPVPGPNVSGADAVTHALAQSSVLNEWSRRADPGAAWSTLTDWVVTLPTKLFYVDNNETQYGARDPNRVGGLPDLIGPFTKTFQQDRNGKSCDDVRITVYDREEQTPRPEEVVYPPFSPWTPPTVPTPPQLCYEANVLTFNKGALLGADRSLSIQGYPESFLFGWMQIDFIKNPLPAIGFAITSRDSATSGLSLLSEAALYDHSYIRPEPVR